MKDKALVFWDKFLEIKDPLMDIDELDEDKAEELLLKLDSLLKNYSEGVEFELGDLTSDGRELNFTALGDETFFPDVICLMENAPVLDFWQITAFSKPEGKNVSIDYEGISLHSKDMFFIPMESENAVDKIGIKVACKNLKKTDDMLAACYFLCEKMIGEYYATTLIDYFDIEQLPADYEEQGYLPLDYLPDFTQWKIERIETAE
ncbi:MAG: hypothetical protein IJ681_04005 [Bacteroidales bacterium]|nr:hypothetical protein [Bacteroidales bacterium]